MNRRLLPTLALVLLQFSAVVAAEPGRDAKPAPITPGYKCVFMGHSFFAPIASGIEAHAKRAGFKSHQQRVFFAGGSKGTPGWLWKSDKHRKQIQTALEAGNVELVGMTYTAQYSELKDFKLWVDFALKHNPNAKFFIARPWIPYPQSTGTSQYAKVYEASHAPINLVIDKLREAYPKNAFFSINYGQSAVELRRLFDAGELPEINSLMTNGKQGKTGIYRDRLGHADRGNGLLISLSELVWLATIYQVDLTRYDWMPKCQANLKAVAAEIVAADPYCQIPRQLKPALDPGASPATAPEVQPPKPKQARPKLEAAAKGDCHACSQSS